MPSNPFDAEPSANAPQNIFFGDDGLRAGWSLLLFLGLLTGLGFAADHLLAYLHLLATPGVGAAHQEITPRSTLLRDGVGFVTLALGTWAMSRIERRPFRRFGLPGRHAARDFLIGLAWGFIFLSGLIGTLAVIHHLVFEGTALHGALAWSYAARWALAFLCVGLYEEFLLRGYLQYTLARGVSGMARALSVSSRHTYAFGFWISASLFSIVLFALAHLGNGGETVAGLFAVALAGLVFVFSLWRTSSLWWAIGFHTAWDWAQTCFYGTPDSGLKGVGHLLNTHPVGNPALSGGLNGPEGSLFVIPTLLLALLTIHITLPFRPRFLTPDQRFPVDPAPANHAHSLENPPR